MTKWELHGMEFSNCNCSYGCPCQFDGLPTHGHCQVVAFFRFDRGHFGGVKLDGLNVTAAVAWPGAIHEGRGAIQWVIDERADEAQRNTLFSIVTGKESDPMAFFAIITSTCETIHDPIYAAISIDVDMEARRADCKAESMASGRGAPILNPVTGEEHRAGIVLPNGFEYGQNQVGRGWSTSSRGVILTLENSYAHWCEIHFNQDGRIH